MSEIDQKKIKLEGQALAVGTLYEIAKATGLLRTAAIEELYDENTGTVDSLELKVATAMALEDALLLFDGNRDGRVSFKEILFEDKTLGIVSLATDEITHNDNMSNTDPSIDDANLVASEARGFISGRYVDLVRAFTEDASISFSALDCHIVEAVNTLDQLDGLNNVADGTVEVAELVAAHKMFGAKGLLENLNMQLQHKWGSSLSQEIEEIRKTCGDLGGGPSRVQEAPFDDFDSGLTHQANTPNPSESNKGRIS